MFELGKEYTTANRSKVVCQESWGNGWFFRVISGGHGVPFSLGGSAGEVYLCNGGGKFSTDETDPRLHGMDVIGPWIEEQEQITKYPTGEASVLGEARMTGAPPVPSPDTPKHTITFNFETEAQKEAFLAWFLKCGVERDLWIFATEHAEFLDTAHYDKDTNTINLSKVE